MWKKGTILMNQTSLEDSSSSAVIGYLSTNLLVEHTVMGSVVTFSLFLFRLCSMWILTVVNWDLSLSAAELFDTESAIVFSNGHSVHVSDLCKWKSTVRQIAGTLMRTCQVQCYQLFCPLAQARTWRWTLNELWRWNVEHRHGVAW